MHFNEALFWTALTAFGTGLYFIMETSKKWIAWGVMILGAGGMGYSVYRNYHSESLGLPIWLYLLAVTWILIGTDVYDRKWGSGRGKNGKGTAEWRQRFSVPRFELVDDHKFENEEIVVDNKSFRRCSFKNVKFLFHGLSPFEFVEGTTFDRGTVFFTTDDPAIMLFGVMQAKIASLPGARVQPGALDSKGRDVPLSPLTVEQVLARNYPRHVLTVQEVSADDPATDPGIYYKDKIRVILTNHLDRDVFVWTPMWQPSEVQCQYPLGSLLQVEGPKGWKLQDWGNETESAKVPMGVTFRCWIGLVPPTGQSIKRRLQTRTPVGTAIFPVKIDGKLYEIPISVI